MFSAHRVAKRNPKNYIYSITKPNKNRHATTRTMIFKGKTSKQYRC